MYVDVPDSELLPRYCAIAAEVLGSEIEENEQKPKLMSARHAASVQYLQHTLNWL